MTKRLMLGIDSPMLLVEIADQDINNLDFKFIVINGGWNGHIKDGVLYCEDDTVGNPNVEIMCDNQDRLRGDYNDVFFNFSNPDYVAPAYKSYHREYDDDEIPF